MAKKKAAEDYKETRTMQRKVEKFAPPKSKGRSMPLRGAKTVRPTGRGFAK